jgi:hypothetical protein
VIWNEGACLVTPLIHRRLGDDDVHLYVVGLRVDRLQTGGLEGDADDERKRYQRRECSVVVATAVAKTKALFVKAQARDKQTFRLNSAALRRHRDAEVSCAHRRVCSPCVKGKHFAINHWQGRNAPRIRRDPRSHDCAQIGLATNWKVKPHRMHARLLQPIGDTALQPCFKLAPVIERCAQLDQACALQLLVGSTIQLPPYATNKCCASVAIVGFTSAVHDLIRVR